MVVTEKHLPEPVFEVARIFPEKLEESEKYSPEPVLEAICLFQERLEKPVLSPGTAIPSVRLSELRPKERLAGRMSLVHLEPGLVEGPFSLNSEVPDRWKMPEVNMRCPQCILLCLGKYWKGVLSKMVTKRDLEGNISRMSTERDSGGNIFQNEHET